MQKDHNYIQVTDPVVHVRAQWIVQTAQITQHALKVSDFKLFKLNIYMEEERALEYSACLSL